MAWRGTEWVDGTGLPGFEVNSSVVFKVFGSKDAVWVGGRNNVLGD